MQKTIQYIENELRQIYPESEIQGLTRIIIESVTGWNYTQQILNKGEVIKEADRKKIQSILVLLKKYEPIQYILGEAEFFGMKFRVNSSVLIPRQETEELVEFIIEKTGEKEISVLDIGTGSGCIALALKKKLNNAQVFGADISEGALEVARENAQANHLDVNFFQTDILTWENRFWENYDVIVSNPPYVRESEKKQMLANVLDYEPASALFVPDDDALLFYRRITEFAIHYLKNDGSLFFEINENLGDEMERLLQVSGFKNIELRSDINGKKRMIYGTK